MSNQVPIQAYTLLCSPQYDNVFGPIVDGCRQNFDFTLLFEQCIFSILPSSIFLLLAPLRIYRLRKEDTKTAFNLLLTTKLVIAGLLAALQFILLVSWSLFASSGTRASIPSAVLNFAVALEIIVLSYLEHYRSIRPSSLLNIYLLITFILDIIQARTVYMQRNQSSIAPTLFTMIASKIALLMLEAQGKRSILKKAYQGLSPESTSGILNRSFLWWLNELFIKGSRTFILLQDLYALDSHLTSEPLGRQMQISWDRRSQPEGRFAFLWAIYRCLFLPLLYVIIPRSCLIIFDFAQPFLITGTLDVLTRPVTDKSQSEGYWLIAATALIYTGKAYMSTLHYEHNLYRFITMFRGAAVTLIYNRLLSLQPGVYDESAAITLQSTDVDRVADCLQQFNEIWARLIEVTIGTYLLARQLGWVCVMPLVIVGLSSGGSTLVAKLIGSRQKLWLGAVQRRVAITSSLLSEMRAVKMMGLSKTVASIVQGERIRETELMKGYRWMVVWLNVLANMPWIWAPATTFTVYAIQAALRGSDNLDTTQAFTSLAIMTLLTNPAAHLLSAIPRIAEAIACFDRIQEFLLAPSRTDQRSCLESRVPIQMTGFDISKDPTRISSRSGSEPDLDHVRSERSETSLGNLAVLVETADIRPAKDAEIALHDISLRIERSSITMVVGPVGAGKSTLLRALLGEIPCDHGNISVVTSHMAYCAQIPWLPNSNIREAICGSVDRPTDDEWYQAVLHACALNHDIANLPDGHQTRIGSKGVMLSGGQKQRIALARAVYSRSKILMLDDVLSALDKRTERTVVDRMFGPEGIFRKHGSTVVLITHARQSLPLADKIVVLSASGEVIQQGTYEELKSDDSVNATLQNETELKTTEDDGKIEDSKAKLLTEKSSEEQQDLARQIGDMAVYRYYFNSIGIVNMSTFLFFVIVTVFTTTFSQIWLKWWTDIDGGQIGLYTSIYFLLALFNSLGHIGYIWAICVVIAPSTGRKLHLILLQTVMRAPQTLFTETETGTLLNRFSQDMTLIEGQLSFAVLIFGSHLFSSLAEAALISVGSSWMALTLPAFIFVIYILQHLYLRTSRQLQFLDLETRSPVYSHFLETLDGLSTIQAFGWEKASKDLNVERLDASQKPYYLMYCIQRWLALVLDLFAGGMAIIVVSLALNLRGSTSPGLLGVSLNSVLTFNSIVSSFITGWTLLETSLGAIARLRGFEANTAVEAKEGEDVQPPPNWPTKGVIDFQDVTASHNPSAIALRNVTMMISPGQKVGICGRTGSGKSSLIATILRILEIDSGTITIDGIDLATLPRETIRERLIAMPQDALHLIGSIRLNADPFGTNSDPDIIAALTKVRLWETLEERGGLDADIIMQSLSQGQQQLFALGRAMLQKSTILLLDEATSSVDAETDRIMQKVIREEFEGYTILTVAHRLDTIMDADRIIVLDGGRVVEFGEPGELMGRDSLFRRLARS